MSIYFLLIIIYPLVITPSPINSYMDSVQYKDMKKGEYYVMCSVMSNTKQLSIFKLADSQPVVNSFTIILVSSGWATINAEDEKIIRFREHFASTIMDSIETIFKLDQSEINTHIIIPQI